jgi:hypothetical protein
MNLYPIRTSAHSTRHVRVSSSATPSSSLPTASPAKERHRMRTSSIGAAIPELPLKTSQTQIATPVSSAKLQPTNQQSISDVPQIKTEQHTCQPQANGKLEQTLLELIQQSIPDLSGIEQDIKTLKNTKLDASLLGSDFQYDQQSDAYHVAQFGGIKISELTDVVKEIQQSKLDSSDKSILVRCGEDGLLKNVQIANLDASKLIDGSIIPGKVFIGDGMTISQFLDTCKKNQNQLGKIQEQVQQLSTSVQELKSAKVAVPSPSANFTGPISSFLSYLQSLHPDTCNDTWNSAIGHGAFTSNKDGKYNTVFGSKANCSNVSGRYNVVCGYGADVTGTGAVHGTISEAIVIGSFAHAMDFSAIAIGCTHTDSSMATIAAAAGSIAIGSSNQLAAGVVARGAEASGFQAISIGSGSLSSNINSIAIGPSSLSTLPGAIKAGATADGVGAVAIGGADPKNEGAVAKGDFSVALGVGALAKEKNSMALGFGAKVDKENVIQLGNDDISIVNTNPKCLIRAGSVSTGLLQCVGVRGKQPITVYTPGLSFPTATVTGSTFGGIIEFTSGTHLPKEAGAVITFTVPLPAGISCVVPTFSPMAAYAAALMPYFYFDTIPASNNPAATVILNYSGGYQGPLPMGTQILWSYQLICI